MAGAPLGNQNAAKAKRVREAIMRALARAGGTVDEGLDKACDALVALAMKGDQWAFSEMANRIDGKPAQSLHVSGEDGGPVKVQRIERVIVKP